MQNEQLISKFVPLSSSQAGGCLTFANWEETGTKMLSFHLSDLLMKPGLLFLNGLTDIRTYFNWGGLIVLNAQLGPANHEGVYTIRSSFTGEIIRLDISNLFALIVRLRPDKVILPPESGSCFDQVWQNLPKEILPYFHASDYLAQCIPNVGDYLLVDSEMLFSSLLKQLNKAERPIYIKGDLGLGQISQLATLGKHLIESDKPASDGLKGMVYSKNEVINILDSERRDEHKPIDAHCKCSVCKEGFTRAYLHHLFQHTPLLAQRYLILHNLYRAQHIIGSVA